MLKNIKFENFKNKIIVAILSGILYFATDAWSMINTLRVDVAVIKTEVKILTKNQDRFYEINTNGKRVDNLAIQDIIKHY